MRTSFVPQDFTAPRSARIGNFVAKPITTDETMEDWLVLLANADAIVKQRGGGSREEWPYSCTLEENFKDLAWLEVCAAYKQLFCYVLRDKKGTYVGAVYIYPIDLFYAAQGKDYDVDFSFWITDQAYKQGQYEPTFRLLLDWLRTDWPFEQDRIYLRNAELPAGIA